MDELNPPERPAGIPPPGRPPGLVRRLYREEGAAWRRHYRKYFKYAARALGLGFVAGFLFFSSGRPRKRRPSNSSSSRSRTSLSQASPLVLALTLFYHNARASVVAVAAGVVPFLFLPILDPLLNGGVLGLLVSISKHQRLDVPRLVLTQILPHGVFELTAVLYATSRGALSFGGHGAEGPGRLAQEAGPEGTPAPPAPALDFLETYPERTAAALSESPARNVVRSFVLVVLPLLLVAAFIEGSSHRSSLTERIGAARAKALIAAPLAHLDSGRLSAMLEPGGAMRFTFAHNNINVLDLGRSLAFYKEALGLEEVRRKEGEGRELHPRLSRRRPHAASARADLAPRPEGTLRSRRQRDPPGLHGRRLRRGLGQAQGDGRRLLRERRHGHLLHRGPGRLLARNPPREALICGSTGTRTGGT